MRAAFKGGEIPGLLWEHGEKAAFTVSVLCFLLFAHDGLEHESLPPDKQPNKLLEAASEARSSMESQAWNPAREGLVVVDYRSRARRKAVAAADYVLGVPFDRPVRLPHLKRGDPELFAAVDLRAASGMGALALKRGPNDRAQPANPAGRGGPAIEVALPFAHGVKNVPSDARLTLRQWAVVTALVPYRKQVGEFERTFRDAVPVALPHRGGPGKAGQGKAREQPVYAGLQVERAEVVDGAAGAPRWQPVLFGGYFQMRGQWAAVAADLVAPEYTDPVYTMPLGPLVASKWDASVGHHPEIPLAADEPAEQQRPAGRRPAPAEAPAAPAVGFDFARRAPGQEPAEVRPRQAELANAVDRAPVEYRLLRIFDFDVELGKTYQYRVQLTLYNPNFDLADRLLQNIASKQEEFRRTPWSAASPPVKIRPVEEILFAGAQPAHGSKDKTIRTKLMTLDPELGVPAIMEEEIARGALLSFREKVEVADLVGGIWLQHDVAFQTDALLLDVRGGRSLSTRDRTLTEPGEALFFSSDGMLRGHSELDDAKPWAYYATRPKPENRRNGL